MKSLSIQQPWASLICGGIKDVENRSWRVKEAPGRILIHAGKTMRFKLEEMPPYYALIIDNAIVCGQIPQLKDMPLGAIVGYADVVGFTEELTSVWDQVGPGAEWKWQLANPRFFKHPIPYKGKQSLFEVPEIDADNFPEAYEAVKPRRDGESLILPLNDDIFKSIDSLECINLFLTEEVESLILDEELQLIPTPYLKIINSKTGEERTVAVEEVAIVDELDDEGKPIIYYDPDGNELGLCSVEFYLDK